MNIFYNKNSLNDTLLISISNDPVNNVEHHKKYTVLKSNEKYIGINIFNVSDDMDLPNGYLYPNEKILNYINKISNINFTDFVHPTLVVAKIEECEDIPNTHLHKCIVNIGNDKVQIICGAKNAREGLITVCALNNTFLPNGNYISNGELMGYKSFGMLCSAKELGLSIESNGIIELENIYKIGEPYKKVYANE